MVNLKMRYVVGALSSCGAERSSLEVGFSLAHLGPSVAPEKTVFTSVKMWMASNDLIFPPYRNLTKTVEVLRLQKQNRRV